MATSQLDLLKTLGDNTRYAIYLELARASVPKTTAEISETLSLHPNTVRPHLERMREVGLLLVEVGGRGEVGRPQHRYSVAPDAPSLGLEPPTISVLARMVLSMAQRLDGSASDAEAVGYDEGARRAALHVDSRPPSKRWSVTLTGLVSTRSSPTIPVTIAVGDDVGAVISFGHCPFADLAREHPDLVCGLHKGMVAGSLTTWVTPRLTNSVP